MGAAFNSTCIVGAENGAAMIAASDSKHVASGGLWRLFWSS